MSGLPTISAIAAVASNGVIGRENALPWRIPADMQYFKRMTLGKPVIMGRATYQSLGKPLPGRTNIVLTSRAEQLQGEGLLTAATPEQALASARQLKPDEIMILGGAQVWTAFMPMINRLYITRIARDYEGDVFFPAIDWDAWKMTSEDHHDGDPPFAFQLYERIGHGA